MNSNTNQPSTSSHSGDDDAKRKKMEKIRSAMDFLTRCTPSMLYPTDFGSKLHLIICMQHVAGFSNEAIEKVENLAAIIDVFGISRMSPETLKNIHERADALARVLRVQILSDIDGVREWQQSPNGVTISEIQETLVNNLVAPMEYFDGSAPFGLPSNASTSPFVASQGPSTSHLQPLPSNNNGTSQPSTSAVSPLRSSLNNVLNQSNNAPSMSLNELMALVGSNHAPGLTAANNHVTMASMASATTRVSINNPTQQEPNQQIMNWNQMNQQQQRTTLSAALQPMISLPERSSNNNDNDNNMWTLMPQPSFRLGLGLNLSSAQPNPSIGMGILTALAGLDNSKNGGGVAAANNLGATFMSSASGSQNNESATARNASTATNPLIDAHDLLRAYNGGNNGTTVRFAGRNNAGASTVGNFQAGNARSSFQSVQQFQMTPNLTLPLHQQLHTNQGALPSASQSVHHYRRQQNYLKNLLASSASESDTEFNRTNTAATMPRALLSMQMMQQQNQQSMPQQQQQCIWDSELQPRSQQPQPNAEGSATDNVPDPNKNNREFPARFVLAAAAAVEEHESSKLPTAAQALAGDVGAAKKEGASENEGATKAVAEEEEEGEAFSEYGDESWNNMFYHLCKFIVEKGHPRVPSHFQSNKKLGNWVAQQRSQYKLFRSYQNSSLTEDRIAKLNSVGFVWVVRQNNEAAWYARFEELKAYKLVYGDCKVPQRHPENKQLGTWVKTQRRQYQKFRKGEQTSMTEERIVELNSIGFCWQG